MTHLKTRCNQAIILLLNLFVAGPTVVSCFGEIM
jgi:hypothetical protein